MILGRPGRASVLAFLTAAVTLMSQVLVHRMVSAKLVNNYAFLIISLTMLGFALSGVLLSRWMPRLVLGADDFLLGVASLFALTLIGASVIFYAAPPGTQWALSRTQFLHAFLRTVPLALLYAIPFACAGLTLGCLLSAPSLPTRRVYCWDLVGSSTGALLVIPAIGWLGAERAALLGCAILVTGTLLLSRPRGVASRSLAAAALAAIALAGCWPQRVFAMRYPPGSVLGAARDPASGVVLEHVAWDAVARIEMSRIPPPDPEALQWPALLGTNRAFLTRFRRILTQNNTAFTYAVEYDGDAASLRGIEETLYAAAYQALAREGTRVLVIGVGGGFDVLTALRFGAADITGVEVNGATVDILRHTFGPYFRPWVEDPRVHLVQDEGRHFLARCPKRFDVIQLSGVDSASGSPAAAHVFSENYLYTAEAFDLYLARLSPNGIINMMRQEYVPPREMLRALSTAVAALRRAGVARPREHVVTLTARNRVFTAMLVKKEPFTPEETARLASWAERSPYFGLSASPWVEPAPRSLYQAFLDLDDPRREEAFRVLYPFDVRPVGDDRPFFFKHSYWRHLLSRDPVERESVPVMELGLLLLLGSTALAAIVCVYLPLRQLAAAGLRTPWARRYGMFFAAIGLGYLAFEMALLQKFGLFLGHPNYALSVVLASLLLATGLGSLFSAGILRAAGSLRFVGYALAGLILLEYGLALPRLGSAAGWPFASRCAIVFALVLPIGVALGTYLPTGLEDVKRRSAGFAPWAWGINGIASVVSPILSVGVSTTWGISALLLSAIPLYLLAGFALPALEAKAIPGP